MHSIVSTFISKRNFLLLGNDLQPGRNPADSDQSSAKLNDLGVPGINDNRETLKIATKQVVRLREIGFLSTFDSVNFIFND